MNPCKNRVSLAASVNVMYSVSVEESATVRCFLDSQLIAAPLSLKMNPVYDLRSTGHPAQSASTNPSRVPMFLIYVIPKFMVPLRYLKMRFAAFQLLIAVTGVELVETTNNMGYVRPCSNC